MEKEKLQEIQKVLKQKYSEEKALISDTFMKSLQIILDKNANITAEEFLHIVDKSVNRITLNGENYKIVIDFTGMAILIDNQCVVSSVTVNTAEPMNIVCNIPEKFNKTYSYKNETSVFVMPSSLKNATMAEKFMNSGAGSSIARALGIDAKKITEWQFNVLLRHLLEDSKESYLDTVRTQLAEHFFDINCGILETDFCAMAYLPKEGLIIDYDNGKVKTRKIYSVNENGDVTYRKEEINFYNFTALEAVDYRYNTMPNNAEQGERLLKLKKILEDGAADGTNPN